MFTCPSLFVTLALSDVKIADMRRAQNLVIRSCKINTLIFPCSNTHAYAQNEENKTFIVYTLFVLFWWNKVLVWCINDYHAFSVGWSRNLLSFILCKILFVGFLL